MNPINDLTLGSFFTGMLCGIVIYIVSEILLYNQQQKIKKEGWNNIELDPTTLPSTGQEVEWINRNEQHDFGTYDTDLFMFHPHESQFSTHADDVIQWRYFKG